MRAFCINAGIGVLLLFALQLTFMAAVLSLTDQALKGNPSKCGAFLIQARDRIEGPMAEPAMESGLNSGEEPPAPKSIVQGFMERNIAPFLLHASDGAHRALLGFFAALFLLGVIGAAQMERGFPLTDVFCDDSYVSDFLRASSKHFPNQAYPFFIVFRGVDYDDAAQRIEMDRIKTEMEALPEVSEKVSNWVSAYERSVYFDATTFSAGLEGFLASPEGVQYGQDIVFADDGSVQASRFIGYLPGDMTADSPLRSAAQQEAMVEKLKTITHGSSLDCFSFSFVMLVWEVWTELIVQMFINLGQVSWQSTARYSTSLRSYRFCPSGIRRDWAVHVGLPTTPRHCGDRHAQRCRGRDRACCVLRADWRAAQHGHGRHLHHELRPGRRLLGAHCASLHDDWWHAARESGARDQ